MQTTLDDVWFSPVREDLPEEILIRNRRRYRIATLVAVGMSYAIDSLFLYLFSLLGKVPSFVFIGYACAGLVHFGLFTSLQLCGFCDRCRNPHLTSWQMALSIAIQLTAMTFAPQIRTYFLAIFFIIFSFGALRLSLKEAISMWFLACASTGLVLVSLPKTGLEQTTPSLAEALVIAASFSTVLLRCLLLNYYGTILRQRMMNETLVLSGQVKIAQEKAIHDGLTGALNRHAITPMLEDLIQLMARKQIPSVIAMIDIDHFKDVNDRFGHLFGDDVLRQLVISIQECIRPTDKLGRYGGEEFILLMPSTALSEGRVVLERVREAIESLEWPNTTPELKVTISAGITKVSGEDSVGDVVSRADETLYVSKSTGRNRCSCFEMTGSSANDLATTTQVV